MQLPLVILGLVLLLSVANGEDEPDNQYEQLDAVWKSEVLKDLKKLKGKEHNDVEINTHVENALMVASSHNSTLVKEVVDKLFKEKGHPTFKAIGLLVSSVYESDEVQTVITILRGGKLEHKQIIEAIASITEVVADYVKKYVL